MDILWSWKVRMAEVRLRPFGALDMADLQGAQSGLPLGTNSSFLRAAVAGGVAPSQVFGLWPGSRSVNPQDGLLVIGGYDRSRMSSNFTQFPVGQWSLRRACPLQVNIASRRLRPAQTARETNTNYSHRISHLQQRAFNEPQRRPNSFVHRALRPTLCLPARHRQKLCCLHWSKLHSLSQDDALQRHNTPCRRSSHHAVKRIYDNHYQRRALCPTEGLRQERTIYYYERQHTRSFRVRHTRPETSRRGYIPRRYVPHFQLPHGRLHK